MRHSTCVPRIYFKDRSKNIIKILKLGPVLTLLPVNVNTKLPAARLLRAVLAGETRQAPGECGFFTRPRVVMETAAQAAFAPTVF